jgi:hypothetical protein
MKKITTAVLIIAVFFGCSKSNNNSTPPTISAGLMPLSVGNFWQFTRTNYDSTGATINTLPDEIDITSQVGLDDTTYYGVNWTLFPDSIPSFFINTDSNTLKKIDSSQYTFFKRVQTDSVLVDSWVDTVTTSRCRGHNYLFAFTDTTNINGYNCLRNVVYVTDCTGFNFEKWVYYLQPGLGLVRVQHYVIKSDNTFYLKSSEDLGAHHLN